MAQTEDLSQFFQTDDFAVTGTFTPAGGSEATVYGIFDNLSSDDLRVSTSLPIFQCATADVAPLLVDAVLTLSGSFADGDYFVRVKRPDGTGISELTLEKDLTQ